MPKVKLYHQEKGKEIKFWRDGYFCNKCEHVWIAIKEQIPIVCPKCNNARWNLEKRK